MTELIGTRWGMTIDLRGGTKVMAHELSVDVTGVMPDGWTIKRLRQAAAEHYGLPLERIPEPTMLDEPWVGVACCGCPYGEAAVYPPCGVPVDDDGQEFEYVDGEWRCWRCAEELRDQHSEPGPNGAPSPGVSPPSEQKVVRITGEQET